MSEPSHIKVVQDSDDLINFLSKYILDTAKDAIEQRGLFTMGVSGGSIIKTLAEVFQKASDIEWTRWAIFFCDERIVPFDSSDSTYGQFKEKVINKVGYSSSWFPIDSNLPPEKCASDYEKQMKIIFRNVDFPNFDILLLGMGPDGHTCSLFPNHDLLEEEHKWVADITDSPKPPPCRVTFTLPTVNNAKNIAFVCMGESKADTLKKVMDENGSHLPASLVKPVNGKLTWIVDKPAASKL